MKNYEQRRNRGKICCPLWWGRTVRKKTRMIILRILEARLKFSLLKICTSEPSLQDLREHSPQGMNEQHLKLTQKAGLLHMAVQTTLPSTRECHSQNYEMHSPSWSFAEQRSCRRPAHFSTGQCQICAGELSQIPCLENPLALASSEDVGRVVAS